MHAISIEVFFSYNDSRLIFTYSVILDDTREI